MDLKWIVLLVVLAAATRGLIALCSALRERP